MDRRICTMHAHLLRLQRSRQQQRTLSSHSLAAFSLFFLVLICSAPTLCSAQCSDSVGCFPPPGNLATGRTVNATSQCTDGDFFCIPDTSDCSNTCSSTSHSPASINDGNTGTAWISSIGSGGSPNVILQLDFQEPVLFEAMTMLWKSPRPQSMVLERSSDRGLTWEAYRYYSSSCVTVFGLDPPVIFPGITGTEAICTQTESAVIPSTNGEVTFNTSEHLLPGISTEDSIAYREITNLRVVLLGQFHLGAGDGYQYYSVGEWVVTGTCMCNGHASTCAPAPGEPLASDKVYSGCMCEHNTGGTHCDSCETGFNAIQWSPGIETDANVCQRCECNGHAEDCTSENLEEGVLCLDCAHNTEGNHCQMCQAGFYENTSLLFTDPNICIACGCDSAGITDTGSCSETGQCNCKPHVTGLQCTQCLDGYWNFTASNDLGCQECECDPRGAVEAPPGAPGLSLCDQLTGACLCRDNVGGNSCNICDDGYYSLDRGCLPCGCNIAGSTGPVCDKESPDGQCPCLPNIDTPTCTTPTPGYFFRHLDYQLYEAEEAYLSEGVTQVFPGPGSGIEYSGRGLVVFPPSGTVSFSVVPPRNYRYQIILRVQFPSPVDPLSLDSVNLFIESRSPVTRDLSCTQTSPTPTSTFLLPGSPHPIYHHVVVDSLCLEDGVEYTVTVQHLDVHNSPWMLDSLLLLPDFMSESAYYVEEAANGLTSLLEECLPYSLAQAGVREECRDIAFSLSVEFYGQVFECNCSGSVGAEAGGVCDRYGGQCSCLEGVTGLRCDVCRNGWFNLTSTGCTLCGCDAEGSTSSVCDTQTGQCDCQPNVESLNCDTCAPGYYNLSSTGCTNCSCSQFTTSSQCSDLGQCSCLPGVGGGTCNQCLPGYYDISPTGCSPCNCSSIGVRSSSNECDVTTGQCPCIGNTVGRDCSQCPEGFYETNSPDTDACLACVCSNRSSVCTDGSANTQAAAWTSDFTQLCSQDPVTCNDGWELLTALGRTAAPFGPSDATGLGYILLSNGDPRLYAPGKFLGDQRSAYGLDLSLSISLSTITGLKDTTSVVLESNEETPPRLVGVFPPPTTQEEPSSLNTILTLSIPLVEDYWHVGSSTGPPATLFQLYSVLSNITLLSLSAEFREDFIEFVYVQNVQLQTRVPLGTPATADLVLLNTSFPTEECSCPPRYTGSSCQLCARGHSRPSGDIADTCVECDCNNLSLDCDVGTAVCTNCSGNSEGDNCERCQPGYYGDPTRGIPCLPCQCPSSERSFSPTCFLDFDLQPTCDNCSSGYSGRSCEECADGFFGNPLVGQCITCECHGNVDPALGPVCDMTTGRCLNCLNNTHGFKCQFCLPGYYGDPPSGLPCTPCQCHPNGTEGDCSPVFGTCRCANENVLGELCDECRDGYWGLSQGLPCVPCNCCSNGSISNTCDKDTGWCDCHENVGSELDDKCCTCTPGFFDFTPDGCRECGCSALSESVECDIVSGQCQCQEGAIGLKCDDCAFGFTGTVPDCTECHPCFHQWYHRIQDLSDMVTVLQRRANFLVDKYYNGYTVESIQADVQGLIEELASTNSSLQIVTLNVSSVQELQDTLQEMNEALAEMEEVARDTEQQLLLAGLMLANTAAFDGTVNGVTVNELVQEIAHYNSTVAALVATAKHLLTEVEEDQSEATSTWTDISALETTIQELLGNSTLAQGHLDLVESYLEELDQQRANLRMNLTHLSELAMDLTTQLTRLNSSVANASRESVDVKASAEELRIQLVALRSHTDLVLELTRQLNVSIETTWEATQFLVENYTTTLGLLEATWQAAQAVSSDVENGLLRVKEMIMQLELIKTAAMSIFDRVLPSLDHVQELARNINASILPESQVAGIVANATASHTVALQALEIAHNASENVRATQSLINQLNSDLNSTEDTQERVQEAVSQLRHTINSLTLQLAQVREGAAEVNGTSSQVQEVAEETDRVVETATELALELQNRSSELMYQASVNNHRSSANEEAADQLLSEVASLQALAEAQHYESLQILQNATDTLSTAQELSNTTNQVTVQQLQELLSEYANERSTVSDLRNRVRDLRAELQILTLTFTQAAQTLNECYKTP